MTDTTSRAHMGVPSHCAMCVDRAW